MTALGLVLGHRCSSTVASGCPANSAPGCGAQVLVSDGRHFVGMTPTSPFAQLGLAQRTVDVLNGMQVQRSCRCVTA